MILVIAQPFREQIILTLILVLIVSITMLLARKAVNKFSILRSIDINRRKIVNTITLLTLYGIAIIFLVIIWGVDMRQFTVFISSILAVLGVGFFAQWSILSSLTASLVLFFYHPVRIGHYIRILDKEFDWAGEVTDITGFYLFMTTAEGRKITIPNNLAIQKGIEILDKEQFEAKPPIPHEQI